MNTELELLKQIAENTSDGSPLYIALVAGGSAIAGALGAAWLSYLGIKETVKSQYTIEQQKLQATIVSAERLRWLQDLRSRMADVFAKMDMQFSLLQRPFSEPQRHLIQKELDALSSDIMVHVNIISFMLNPEKENQGRLRGCLQACQAFLKAHFNQVDQAQSGSSLTAYTELKQVSIESLTLIGTETWEQVKALK